MPFILFVTILVAGLTTFTPAAAAFTTVALGVMFGIGKWIDIEAEHREAGTPWQYRPTLWVILFLLFVGVLVGATLS